MDDILANWKLINRMLPRTKLFVGEMLHTMTEIQQISTYPDKRIKHVISLLLSSGIRIWEVEYLKWKHIIHLENDCAKIIVYAGQEEQYHSFVTPECFNYL